MIKSFKAKVLKEGSGLGWRIVDIPFDVRATFQAGGRVAVKGTVNGAPFRSSLFPRKDGPHFLMLNKKVQKEAGVELLGQVVNVTLEPDDEKRSVTLPKIFKSAFDGETGLLKYFQKLNYSTRKWIVDWVSDPKSLEAQSRRAEQMVMRLMEMRDGEIEPPPILQAVFAQNPKAKLGWTNFTATQRRGHLFGIFSCQTPDTRARRVEKAVKMMLEYADKPAKERSAR